jgi:hypothetical protein
MSNHIRIKQFKQCKFIIVTRFSDSSMKRKMTIKQRQNQVPSAYAKTFVLRSRDGSETF